MYHGAPSPPPLIAEPRYFNQARAVRGGGFQRNTESPPQRSVCPTLPAAEGCCPCSAYPFESRRDQRVSQADPDAAATTGRGRRREHGRKVAAELLGEPGGDAQRRNARASAQVRRLLWGERAAPPPLASRPAWSHTA